MHKQLQLQVEFEWLLSDIQNSLSELTNSITTEEKPFIVHQLIKDTELRVSQQTRDIHPMLFQCWASVEDGGPTLKGHSVNTSCLLGRWLGYNDPLKADPD